MSREQRDREVFAESDGFWLALPRLLEDGKYLGRWVVYRQGVCADGGTFDAAFEAGLALFGPDVGFAVHRVEPEYEERL